MQILLYEIKKILTWRIVLLLSIVNCILFFLLIEFHISHYPNGRPALDSYRVGVEMVNKYGQSMNEEEFADFKQIYEAKVTEANTYLQSKQEFVNAGIKTYQDLLTIEENNEEKAKLRNLVFHEEEVDIFWELQERNRLIEFHEHRGQDLEAFKDEARSEQQRARYEEMIEESHVHVYTEVATENFKRFISNVAIAIVLSVVIVLSPIQLKDRSRNMLELQYTTGKGRSLFKTKIAAGLISATIVMSCLLAIYFGFYSLNKPEVFFDIPMYSFIGNYLWYDLEFLEYIILSTAAIYILGLVFGMVAMSFSSIMPNYVTLIGVQIPLVVGLIYYGLNYLVTNIISIGPAQWVVPTSYLVMSLLSVAYLIIVWKREKKRDIMI